MINGPVSPLGEAKHPLIGSRRLRIELLPSAPPRRHPALDQRLGLLLVATITSLPHARFSHLQPFAPHGWRAIGPAAAVLVWGFAGWEAVTSLAADFRRPARDLPRATGIALVVIGALYLAIATTSILVLGPKAARTEAPLAELLAIGIGGEVKMVAAGAALLLTTGSSVLVYVLGTAAAVKLLPRRSAVHRIAVVALLASTALVAVTGVYVLYTLSVALAALIYVDRRTRAEAHRKQAFDQSLHTR
jgi:amino acid efflux transporter